MNEKTKLEILNDYTLRENIKSKIPEIAKIESLDSLKNLRVTKITLGTEDPVTINYECIGTEQTYPHIRARLIENGTIKEHQVVGTSTFNVGTLEEYESMHLSFQNGRVQSFLMVHNPDHILKGYNR